MNRNYAHSIKDIALQKKINIFLLVIFKNFYLFTYKYI